MGKALTSRTIATLKPKVGRQEYLTGSSLGFI